MSASRQATPAAAMVALVTARTCVSAVPASHGWRWQLRRRKTSPNPVVQTESDTITVATSTHSDRSSIQVRAHTSATHAPVSMVRRHASVVRSGCRPGSSATFSCQDEHCADDSRHADPDHRQPDHQRSGQRIVSPHRGLHLTPTNECSDRDRRSKHDAGDAENPAPDLIHARGEQLTHGDTACKQGQRSASPRQKRPLVGQRESVIGFVVDPRRIT